MINISSSYAYNQPSFKSKDLTIQRADNIARLVNGFVTGVAPRNLERLKHAKDYPNVINNYWKKLGNMRDTVNPRVYKCSNPLQSIKIFVQSMAENHLGNCHEHAKLAYIAARINGIEDITSARIYQIDPYVCEIIERLPDFDRSAYGEELLFNDLDHTVLIINNGNKPYIIDALLGFADYLPNAILRYKNEYGYLFKDLNKNPNINDQVIVRKENWKFVKVLKKIRKRNLQKAFPKLMLPEVRETNKYSRKPHKSAISEKPKKSKENCQERQNTKDEYLNNYNRVKKFIKRFIK